MLWARPYRLPGNSFASMVAASALVVLMVASIQVKVAEKTGDADRSELLLSLVLCLTTFAVFALTLLLYVGRLLYPIRPRWSRSGAPVAPPPLRDAGEVHVLIVCAAEEGPGLVQARDLELRLRLLLPSMRVRVAGDDDAPEAFRAIVAILAGSVGVDGAEHSHLGLASVRTPLERAAEEGRPIVLLHETAAVYGGVSMGAHRAACPDALRGLLASALVSWHASPPALRDVSIREVLQLIFAEEAKRRDGDTIAMPGDVTRQRFRLPWPEQGRYHLYVSTHNAEAAAPVLEAMDAALRRWQESGLAVTLEAEQMNAAHRLLLCVPATVEAFEGLATALLRPDVTRALLLTRAPPLLALEAGDAPIPALRALEEATPAALRALFSEPPVLFCRGSHAQASAATLLRALARPSRSEPPTLTVTTDPHRPRERLDEPLLTAEVSVAGSVNTPLEPEA